jgi:hypothetical protein
MQTLKLPASLSNYFAETVNIKFSNNFIFDKIRTWCFQLEYTISSFLAHKCGESTFKIYLRDQPVVVRRTRDDNFKPFHFRHLLILLFW